MINHLGSAQKALNDLEAARAAQAQADSRAKAALAAEEAAKQRLAELQRRLDEADRLTRADKATIEARLSELAELARRRDVRNLLNSAQTDFTPFLWRILSKPRPDNPTLYDLAAQLHNELIPGPKADGEE